MYSLIGEPAFWIGASVGGALTGHRCCGAAAPTSAYVRAVGLASAPGIAVSVAAAASMLAPGTERVVLPFVAVYRAAALYVALKAAAGLSNAQATIALVAAMSAGLGAVVAVTTLLNWGLSG